MKKALVVEDNEDNLKLITYALKRYEYDIVSAETGEEGVEMAIKEKPSLIIMDINLPGIDGLEATRRIRSSELGDDVPIIAVTSFAMAGDREKVLAAGCNGYFEKPINPLTIMDEIHRVLGVKNEDTDS